MCGRREESANTQCEASDYRVDATETRDQDDAETEQEEKRGGRVPMVPYVGACVAGDPNDRSDPHDRPFDPFICEVVQAQHGPQSRNEWQNGAVQGAGR